MSSTVFFLFFIPILAILLLAVNFIFAPHNPYGEKNSVFECGFHSFLGQNRTQFSISFFIFALLFLLFDLEILLIYPYVVSAYINNVYGLVIMLIFFLALTLGFAFELGKNALKIDSRQLYTIFKKKVTEFNQLANHSLIKINYLKYFSKDYIFNRSLPSTSIRMFSITKSLLGDSKSSSNQESNTENSSPLNLNPLSESTQPSPTSSSSSSSSSSYPSSCPSSSSSSSSSSTYDSPESSSGESTPRASYTGGSGEATPRGRPIDFEHARIEEQELIRLLEEQAAIEEREEDERLLEERRFRLEDDSRFRETVEDLRKRNVGEKLMDGRYVSERDKQNFADVETEYTYLSEESNGDKKEFLDSVKLAIDKDIKVTKEDIAECLDRLGIENPSDNNSEEGDPSDNNSEEGNPQDSKDQSSDEKTAAESVSSEEAKRESDENSDNNSDMPINKGKGIDLEAHPNYNRSYINPPKSDSENKSLDKSIVSDSNISDELPKSNNRLLFDIYELNYFLSYLDKITPYLHYLDNIPLFYLRLIIQIVSLPHIGLILYCTFWSLVLKILFYKKKN